MKVALHSRLKYSFASVFILLVSLIFVSRVFAWELPTPGRVCEGTELDDGTYIPKGQVKEVTIGGKRYRCVGCGECTPISGSQKPHMSSGSGLDPTTQMVVQMGLTMVQSIFSSLVQDLINDLLAPPTSPKQGSLKEQQNMLEQQKKKEREELEKWMSLQAEAELKRLNEEKERKKRGEDILAKVSIGNEGIKAESIGSGQLAPLDWDNPYNFASTSPKQYDTSSLSITERLVCSAYFSKMAEDAAAKGDIESARFYGTQMDNVIQGYPTQVECKPPKGLISELTDTGKTKELNQRYTKLVNLHKEVMPKVEKLQEIETKLGEVRSKREEIEQRIRELDKKIEELRSKTQADEKPDSKSQEDSLLAQALALKAEAEKEHQDAIESEKKLLKEKQAVEEELNKIKEKFMAGER